MIAGNGRFPFLVLDGARRAGVSLAVVAIREETDLRIREAADQVEWVDVGQLGRMLRFFKEQGVTRAIMAGRPIDLFNGGRVKRDFTYVDDIAEGTIAAAQHGRADRRRRG